MEINYANLILRAKDNEKDLEMILRLFQPLVKAYAKKLFFMEREDAEQELRIAIVEAVKSIGQCETEGKSIKYIQNAVRYKFVFLCRKNQRQPIMDDFQSDYIEKFKFYETYGDIETMYDLERQKKKLSQRQQRILDYIVAGYSDKQVGEVLGVSRQYINRVKKTFSKIFDL